MTANIISNEQLTNIIAEVGRNHGYVDVHAEFAPFRDFKMKWSRTHDWINFEVSDYLLNATPKTLAELFETIFEKIRGEDSGYGPLVMEYLTSDDFVTDNQDTFIGRYVGVEDASTELGNIYRELVERDLVDEDPHLKLLTGPMPSRVLGRSSVLMHVAVINRDIIEQDDKDILRYAVFSQIARINLGFRPDGVGGDEYEKALCKYPRRPEVESKLRAAGLHL